MRECDSVSIRNSSDVIVEDDEDKERYSNERRELLLLTGSTVFDSFN